MKLVQQLSAYIIFALPAAALPFLCLLPLTGLPVGWLAVDCALVGLLLPIVLPLLRSVVAYGGYRLLPLRLKVSVYSMLSILFVLCWMGLALLLSYLILPDGSWRWLEQAIPFKAIFALLAYCIALLVYRRAGVGAAGEDREPDFLAEEEAVSEEEQPAGAVEGMEQPADEGYIDRIAIKDGQAITVVPVNEVMCLQAEGDYVVVHTAKRKLLKEQTMKYFEAHLPPEKFVRIHRSSIVNVDYIVQLERYEKQSYLVKLQNGMQVRVSANGYKNLKQTLSL